MQSIQFQSGTVHYYYNASVQELEAIVAGKRIVIVTDSHLYNLYGPFLAQYDTIVMEAGEGNKNEQSSSYIISKLIDYEADRNTILIGFGGGVVTDITGYVASIYMRGIACGYIPTTLLGMVDAAIGGKTGINWGLFKNMVGTFKQPQFILFDYTLLSTLSSAEWSNGFGEIIKYASILDTSLFTELETHKLIDYQQDIDLLKNLVIKCAQHKNDIVLKDEHEQNIRKWLNFGHTAGHAMEQTYELPHGAAVGLGMVVASKLSESLLGLSPDVTLRLRNLLAQYQLPTQQQVDVDLIWNQLVMDKKRKSNTIQYILLENIGSAVIYPIEIQTLKQLLPLCMPS